jgi:CPA2 family monovalent cation:H+ antiporter-2
MYLNLFGYEQALSDAAAALTSTSTQIQFILDIGILSVAALVVSVAFARLKLSIVSGQILAGMIVGPYVLGWVRDPVILNEISEIGIVLLLFIIGLELDPVELRRLLGKVASLTALEVGIAFAFGMLASFILQFDLIESIIFSMTASITSTAIVGKIFLARRMLRAPEAGFLIGVLVIEDIIAVVFLIVLSSITSTNISSFPYFAIGNSPSAKGFVAVLEAILSGVALLALGTVVARYVAPRIINYLSYYEEEFEEIPFLFAIALGFLFAVLAAYLGYSPGIGAFIIGLGIRGKHSRFLENKVIPIKDLFLLLFFVSVGSLIDPYPALALGIPMIIAFLLLILGKFLGGVAIGKVLSVPSLWKRRGTGKLGNDRDSVSGKEKMPSLQAFGVWLIPRGEFSLVIGQLGIALGLVSLQFFSLIGVSVIVTAIVASILQRFTEPKKASSIYPFTGKTDDE